MPNYREYTRRRSGRRSSGRRERRHSGILGRLVVMLAVVAAMVLGVAIFFRVQNVDVQGNAIYAKEQVVTASGVEVGDNLLMVNRPNIVGRIQAKMPYVQKVSVGRILPDTIVIQIQESEIAGLVQTDVGGGCYVNADGRILGQTVEGFRGQIVELTGFTITSPKIGDQAVATEGQSEQMEAALQVLRQMEGTGIIGQITAIDASKSYDLKVHCADRLEILLGSTEQLSYKIQYLQVVLDGLEDYQTGYVDLTFDVEQVARFIPVAKEEPEEDAEEEPEEEENPQTEE